MSKIKAVIRKRRTGKEYLCGGTKLVSSFPYGLSNISSSIEEEMKKLQFAEKMGVTMVRDNSILRKEWYELMKRVSDEIDLPLFAAPTLAAANLAWENGKKPDELNDELFYKGFEKLSDVCDVIEIFPTITKESLETLAKSKRIIKAVISRSGSVVANYVLKSGCESPYYTNLNWFLDQAKEKNITLILGNGFRAACLADSFDDVQMYEVKLIKEFAKKAVDKGVEIMCGIVGHADPTKIELLEKIRKDVPIPIGYLGPLTSDISPGYDHINAAISIVMLRKYMDWVSIVTPAEHIGLPNLDDAIEGITAFKIAEHISDLKKGGDQIKDFEMAKARMQNSWCAAGTLENAINPYTPYKRIMKEKYSSGCTLCGDMCSLVTQKKYLKPKY